VVIFVEGYWRLLIVIDMKVAVPERKQRSWEKNNINGLGMRKILLTGGC
jgi:hypothetical protein